MSSLGGPNIVTSGLVLHLDAANPKSYPGTGNTWYDRAANLNAGVANNGTLINGPTFDSGNGGSIVFDGVDDYVNCGPTTNTISNIFTYCFWATKNSGGTLLGNSKDGGGTQITIDSTLFSLVKQNIVVMGSCSTFSTLSNWNYYCVSYSSPNITFYINGNLITTVSYSTTFDFSNSDRWVGTRANVGNPYQSYKGKIAQTLIYNKVLSPQEVLQNYNATKSRYGL